tara:strand:- start:378 stop:1268 length:891 start_codon:yes stop_codon:yes gene_type:complete
MAYTDTDVSVGALDLAIGGAIVQFNKVAVMPQTLNMVACPQGAVTARIPVYAKLAIANVETASAGAEGAENSEVITTAAKDIEVLRNHIDVTITDLAAHGNADALMINAGQAIGNAVALEFDSQACALIDDFATQVGANTTGMSMSKLFAAVGNLETNDAPRPYSCVLAPLSVWGDFGISNELGSVAVNESAGALNSAGSAVGEAIRGAGQVTVLGGVSVYTSPSVASSGAGTAQGGCFAKTAVGCAYIDFGGGGFVQIETQRDSKAASTDMTANGYFGFLETVDLHGVTILNETA